MSNFEFITVLFAIIIGIGIAHLLLSVGRLLGETKSSNVGAVHLVWTVNLMLVLVGYWWWVNGLRYVEEWSFLQLFLVFTDISLWCLLAAVLYPVTMPHGYDLREHFAKKRKALFSILIVLAFLDPSIEFILGAENLIELGWPYLHLMAVCLFGGIAGIRYGGDRFQLMLAIYWGFSLLAQTMTFPVLR